MNRPMLPYGVRVIGLEIMNLLHPRLTDPFLRLPGEYLNCCGIDEPNDPGGVQSDNAVACRVDDLFQFAGNTPSFPFGL